MADKEEKTYWEKVEGGWVNRTMVRAKGDTSQFGESTLVAEALKRRRAVPDHRWCFECGAGDPVELSTSKMFRDQGWCSVLIERSHFACQALRECAGPNAMVIEAEAWVRPSGQVPVADVRPSLGDLLHNAKCPHCGDHFPINADFGVIDVDGQDYWMWHDLEGFRPSVMVVEFSPYVVGRGGSEYIPSDAHIPNRGSVEARDQAGGDAILELGRLKRYKPIFQTLCNLIFLRDDE